LPEAKDIEMNNTTNAADSRELPYKPSWIDRFTNWVEELPIWNWVFYVGLGLVLIMIQVLVLWLDGGLQVEALRPVIIYNGLATPYILALIHLFDKQSVAAFNSMRSSLAISEPEFDKFQHNLSTMPWLAPLIAGLIMAAMLVITERVGIAPARYTALNDLPNFKIVYHVVDKSTAFAFGVFIYHTIRQLRLVNTIYVNHLHISLSSMGPLQAFSKLTAATALAQVIGIYVWHLINPDLLRDPVSLGLTVAVSILTVVVFVWPLLGARQLIGREKEGMLHEIDRKFEAAFAEFNHRFYDDDTSTMERLSGTIASLEIQRNRIKAIPAWPWSSETARFTFGAIALPLLIWILQYIIAQALDM
jgi:hypothetical protein